jgi:transmembrane sensor
MHELDRKLREGPLRVASLFHPDRSENVAREGLRRRRRAMLVLASGGACALVLSAALALRMMTPGAPPRQAGAEQGVQTEATIRFADGSTAVPASQGAQVQIDEQTATRVALRLRGAARFDVVADRARSFEVRAGDVLVRVLGTAFSIDGRGPRTRVAVERGRVEVSWPGGRAILHPGEARSFPGEDERANDRAQRAALDDERTADGAGAAPRVPATPDAIDSATAPAEDDDARRAGGWRAAARRGDYERAYAQLAAAREGQRAQPADLMLAADVARLSGHPQAAIAPLRALCQRFPGDKRAPVAAFTLGRVLLDELDRAEQAAQAFARARELWPAGPLAEDALAREAEAWSRAGNTRRARATAQRYEQRFPDGRHRASVRRFLAP